MLSAVTLGMCSLGIASASCWLAANLDDIADAGPDGSPGGCPGDAGPAMVRIGDYCIDSTEVTNADYAAFLGAGAEPAPRPECTWKDAGGHVPACGASWPQAPGTEQFPVECVDWCDADAYCRWAGKRLCGRIGGGPTAPTSREDPELDQWYRACTRGGQNAFPYGNDYDPSACNGLEFDAGYKVFVQSLPCEGGFPGIFDLIGNLAEWTDSCQSASGAMDYCLARGGEYDWVLDAGCRAGNDGFRGAQDHHLGFRCCAP